jgi:hypothetical protein
VNQTLLSGLHDKVQQSLAVSRQSFGHPGTKGDASEKHGWSCLKRICRTGIRRQRRMS